MAQLAALLPALGGAAGAAGGTAAGTALAGGTAATAAAGGAGSIMGPMMGAAGGVLGSQLLGGGPRVIPPELRAQQLFPSQSMGGGGRPLALPVLPNYGMTSSKIDPALERAIMELLQRR